MSMDRPMSSVMNLQDSLDSELWQVNPGRTMKYKVADYQQGVRKSGSLFTRVTLKGGPIEPREIVDAYINANRSLFQVKKDLKLDMDAARVLGISEENYDQAMDRDI